MSRPEDKSMRSAGNGSPGRHVESQIPALVSGAASPALAANVRDHCRACARCAKALEDYASLWDLLGHHWNTLGDDGGLERADSIWERVRAALPAQIRLRLRAARITLAFGVTAAVCAGLALGFFAGSKVAPLRQTSPGHVETGWSEAGSLLAGGNDPSLGDIYLDESPGAGAQEASAR